MARDFQDEQNEDGANEVAKKGPVPPAKHKPIGKAHVPDFQDDQNESGVTDAKLPAESTVFEDKEMGEPGQPAKPA